MILQTASAARENMLKSQILTGHVLEPRILNALMNVAREDFVPEAFRGAAYVDQEIPLGGGRFLMEPLDFARMLKIAAIREDESVLVVGANLGYCAAVLSYLARKVVAVEEDDTLVREAGRRLAAYPNVTLHHGPLVDGARDFAPYDAIVVEGAIEFLSPPLSDALREGGRLLAAEHDADALLGTAGLSKLVEYRKVKGGLYRTVLRDANMALLPQFRKPPEFVL